MSIDTALAIHEKFVEHWDRMDKTAIHPWICFAIEMANKTIEAYKNSL